MSTLLDLSRSNRTTFARDIEHATRRIAPLFPLDRFVAVNPWWGHVAEPIEQTAAELGVLHGAKATMPRSHWREEWRAGRLRRENLEAAIEEAGGSVTADELVAAMHETPNLPSRLPTVLDLADAARRPSEPEPWTEVVVHQISQHAAAWFDRAQSSWGLGRDYGLYGSWRQRAAQDRSLPRRSAFEVFAQRIEALPETPRACIELVDVQLGLFELPRADYYSALLGSVRGWASYCAYERWQQNLNGAEDDQLVHLLGIRMAWESILLKELQLHDRLSGLQSRWRELGERRARHAAEQRVDWLLLRAAEIAWSRPFFQKLATRRSETRFESPIAEAVFCIDVRSERMRRAIEQVGRGALATRGFAGFFGMPAEFRPAGAEGGRPHLPALLAPSVVATEVAVDEREGAALVQRRQEALASKRRWDGFKTAMPQAFAFVESMGLGYAIDLVRDTFGCGSAAARSKEAGLSARERERLRPSFGPPTSGMPLARRVELARSALVGMGMVRQFARLVLLIGHGSSSANNAHAHALDCGACGGQTGEVSSRLLVELLQDHRVREGLRATGIDVPDSTVFVAGLHDTTTDEVRLLDTERVPAACEPYVRRLREWFAEASDRVRRERAPSLSLAHLADDPHALRDAVLRRSRDWAETRPEWGLAGNAAIVFAPRSRTRHLDLEGRVFLHEYDARADADGSLLPQLLGAPGVVAHWINFQYYASTVDNRQFGSGNKLLHNVVGAHVGVFEGNGGDLRAGLPMQSLHDGQRWRHEPLRLTLVVEASESVLEAAIRAQPTVQNLVDHGYVHVARIGEDGAVWTRRRGGGFARAAVGEVG